MRRSRRAKTHAAERGRWASKSNMSSERNRHLNQRHECMCANNVTASRALAICSSASQLCSSTLVSLNSIAVGVAVLVPSLGAQLRSSARRSTCADSSSAIHVRSVVRLETSAQFLAHRCRSAALPNKSLVPTPVSSAPLLSIHRGAAHLRRSLK